MSAAGTFLRNPVILIEVNNAIGAGIYTFLMPMAFDGIDDDQSIVSFRDSAFFTYRNTRGIVTMLAHHGNIMYLYFR
jgi:hypothetical protein